MSTPIETPRLETPEEQTVRLDKAALLVQILSYYDEAKTAREGGPRPRDQVWRDNDTAYWAGYDYSKKAEWQSTQRLPEVQNAVERFAAAIKLTLVSNPDWYTIRDFLDKSNQIVPLIVQVVRVFLDRCGKNATGQPISFEGIFGDLVKAGAKRALCVAVVWEEGRVQVQPVNAREIYLDPSGRGMYRIRRYMIDKSELENLAKRTTRDGQSLYNAAAIERLQAGAPEQTEEEDKRADSTHDPKISADGRSEIEILEFLGKINDRRGQLQANGKRQLVVIANRQEIIRGAEPNPMRHGHDWIIYAPMLRSPDSVYHRSYVESFAGLAAAFNDLTNLIMDGVAITSVPSYMAWPHLLEDPSQLNAGVAPGDTYIASDEAEVGKDFIKPVDRGSLGTFVFTVWNAIKQEFREATSQNELTIGQLTRGETTATEVVKSSEGTDALKFSIADDLENHFLSVMIELVWLTAVQHLTDGTDQDANGDSITDEEILAELTPEVAAMIVENREEFLSRRLRYKAKGITGSLERGTRARSLIAALQTIGANPILAEAFQREHSITKVIDVLLRDMNINVMELQKTDEEKMQDRRNALEAVANGGLGGAKAGAGGGGGGGPGLGATGDGAGPPGVLG